MVELALDVELVDAAVDFDEADVSCPDVVAVDWGVDELLAVVVDDFAVLCEDTAACEFVDAAAGVELLDAEVVAGATTTADDEPLVDGVEAAAALTGVEEDVGALVGIATGALPDVELENPDRTVDATAFALLTMLATSTVAPDDDAEVPEDAATSDVVDGLATEAMAVVAEMRGFTAAVVGVVEFATLPPLDDVVDVVPEVDVVADVPDEPLVPDDDVVEVVGLFLEDPDELVAKNEDAMPDRIEPRFTIDSPCMKQGVCCYRNTSVDSHRAN